MSKSVLAATLSIVFVLSGSAWGQKILEAHRAEQPPTLDGKLIEACWEKADQAKDFSVIYVGGQPAEEQTIGRVIYDDDNVYIGIEGLEPRMYLVKEAVAKNPDTFDYGQGQTIEIFLGVRGDRRNFLQLMVNTNGTWMTYATEPMQLKNIDIETTVHLADDRFTMEIKIPFSVLHPLPDSEGLWDLNIGRARTIEGGYGQIDHNRIFSIWQNTGGPFRQPASFGRLKIPVNPTEYFYVVEANESHGDLVLKTANRTGKDRDVVLEVLLSAEDEPENHPLSLKADQTVELKYPIPDDGIDLEVTIRDAKTGKIYYRGGTALKEIDDPLLMELEKDFEPADISEETYVVFVKDYMARSNHRTLPQVHEIDQTIKMFASLGEYQPASFAVRTNSDLEQVKVSLIGDLEGPNGATISKDSVEIRIVELMNNWHDAIEYVKTECFLIRNRPRNIPADTTQRYWLTLQVPEDAVPGDYRTTVKVSPENEETKQIALEVQVLPIRLEQAEGMNYFMYFGVGSPINLPVELRTEEYLRMIFEDMREHGMTTVTLYGYPGGREWADIHRDAQSPISMVTQLDLMRDTGLVADWAAVPWVGAETFGHDVWKMVMDAATERNWPELLFYFVDEPGVGRFDRVYECMDRLKEFKEQYPEYSSIRTTTAGADNPVIAYLYDVWITGDHEAIDRGRHMGKTVWTYDCTLAPVDAINARHYFGLWSWKSGVKGASFWAYMDLSSMENRFMMPARWRDSELDLTDYKNIYSFVYPSSEELIPSIGWEATREGVYDYRYLWTLKKTIDRAREANVSSELIAQAGRMIREIENALTVASMVDKRTEATERVGIPRREFERHPPEPTLADGGYDQLRYKVAQEIIKLNAAIKEAGFK